MPAPASADAGLPRALAQAWGLAPTPQRGPKAELSADRIVAKAVAIADTEGLPAVTMARVAKELGFTTMSLYRHVANKDDLLQLMNDAAGADIPIPSEAEEQAAGATWRETLAEWARAARRHYLRHPWVLDIPVSGTPSMPSAVRFADWALRGMRHLPLTDAERISLLLTLSALASSFARFDVQLTRAVAEQGEQAVLGAGLDAALADVITAAGYPDMHRLISAGVYFGSAADLMQPPPGPLAAVDAPAPVIVEFEYALGLVLDGVGHRVRS